MDRVNLARRARISGSREWASDLSRVSLAHLVVGHSDEGFCFGIKDGIKRTGRNRKIFVWQRIIAGFDPSRPSQRFQRLTVMILLETKIG
jgi:hypothetical protein